MTKRGLWGQGCHDNWILGMYMRMNGISVARIESTGMTGDKPEATWGKFG